MREMNVVYLNSDSYYHGDESLNRSLARARGINIKRYTNYHPRTMQWSLSRWHFNLLKKVPV